MKKLNKGFTIIELVMVIAIIAIMAAVLIPTFASLITKANLSADQVAVKNMNTALEASEPEDGIPANLYELKQVLSGAGFNADKNMIPNLSGYAFLWDSVDNVIVLVNGEDKVVYPEKYNVTIDRLRHFDISYPAAKVNEYGAKAVNTSENQTQNLNCSFTFIGDPEDAETSEYKDWAVDFVVYFDKEVAVTKKGQTGLAGQYDRHGDNWVVLDIFDLVEGDDPVTIQAGTKYDLLQDIVVGKVLTQYKGQENIIWDYEGICELVKTFNCGAFDDSTNAGTTMTVELRLYETITTNEKTGEDAMTSTITRNEDNYIVVCVYKYTF